MTAKRDKAQFQRMTTPGVTPPELAALGLSLVQQIDNISIYNLSGSKSVGNGFYDIITPLWVSVSDNQMWVSRNWTPGVTWFHPYDLSIIREYVLSAHNQYKDQDYKFKPLPPTEDEIFTEALNYNCSDNTEEREAATPWEDVGLAFREDV